MDEGGEGGEEEFEEMEQADGQAQNLEEAEGEQAVNKEDAG